MVLATWHDEADVVARRLRRMGDHAANVSNRLHLLDFAGKGPLWQVPEHLDVGDPRVIADYGCNELAYGGLLDDGSRRTSALTPAGRWLRVYCQHYGPVLLVVDSLETAFADNEDDRSLKRAFMASWDVWTRATECTALFISHASKSEAAHSESTDWQATCGAVWTFGLDHLPKSKVGEAKDTGDKPEKASRLACIKSNYAMLPKPLWLESDDSGTWRVSQALNAAPANWQTGAPGKASSA